MRSTRQSNEARKENKMHSNWKLKSEIHCLEKPFSYIQKTLWSPSKNHSFSSVQSLSRIWLFMTPWITAWTTARPPCPSPTPGVYPNSCPLSRWCHPTISSSIISFSSFNLSQHQGLFQGVSSSHQVAKVLEFQLQHQSFQRTPRTDLL